MGPYILRHLWYLTALCSSPTRQGKGWQTGLPEFRKATLGKPGQTHALPLRGRPPGPGAILWRKQEFKGKTGNKE